MKRIPLLYIAAFFVVAISALSTTVYMLDLQTSRQRLLDDTSQRNVQRALQLSESVRLQMTSLFEGFDLATRELRAAYLRGPETFEASVRDVVATYPDGAIKLILVFDAKGYLSYSSDGSTEKMYFGDREHFLVHSQSGQDHLFISKPVFGRLGKTWVSLLTRPIFRDGKFDGVIVLSLRPDFLARKNLFFSLTIKRQFTAGDLPRYLRDIFFSGPKDVSSLASSRLTPFYRHRTILFDWLMSNFTSTSGTAPSTITVPSEIIPPSPTTPSTSSPEDISKNAAWEESLKAAAQIYARLLSNYQLEGATSAALEHTVAMLHAHGCKVILVELPLTAPFRAMQPPEILAQFPPYIRRLQEKYRCAYVNLWDRVPDAHFVDGHHVSKEGSREFSKIMAQEVIKPAWVKP